MGKHDLSCVVQIRMIYRGFHFCDSIRVYRAIHHWGFSVLPLWLQDRAYSITLALFEHYGGVKAL